MPREDLISPFRDIEERPACSHEGHIDAPICPGCGEPLPQCRECGDSYDLRQGVCRRCFNQEKADQYYKGAADCRKHLKVALAKHSCTTCPHGSWDEDASVGIPLHMEDCQYLTEEICNQIQDDNTDEAYEKTASLCGHWELNPDVIGPQW